MSGILEAVVSRIAGSAVVAGGKSLLQRLTPPKISSRRTPANLFEHIGPGAPVEFVREQLGTPSTRIDLTPGKVWAYRFSDSVVQVEFDDDECVRSLVLALTDRSPKRGFSLPFSGPLGKLTFDDVTSDPNGKLRYRSSLRTWELLFETRGIPHQISNYVTYGALVPLWPGRLADTSFDTSAARLAPRLAAKGVLINWVGVSRDEEEMWFDWQFALPINL